MVIVPLLTGTALWSLHRGVAAPMGSTPMRAAEPDPPRRTPVTD
jgi:hypothetical protein